MDVNLLAPDTGRARISGVDVQKDPNTVRSLIGLAGQYAAVDETLTGRENLIMVGRLYRLGAKLAKARTGESPERLGLVETVVFGATSTAVGLSQDMSNGIIDRFRSLPMSRSAVLAGRTVADLVRNVFVVLLMIVVGMAVGFRFHNGVGPAVAAVFVALLLGYALSWVFALIGLTVADPETAQLAGFLPIFPLVFASSVFVSIQSMPGWLQAFAQNQPISRAADTVRALTEGGPVATDLIWTLLWSTAILAVFIPLAVRRYRKV